MGAELIEERRFIGRICDNCDNAVLGRFGVYCQVYEEEILNVRLKAISCSYFTTGEEGST